jgi:hypothetical protein
MNNVEREILLMSHTYNLLSGKKCEILQIVC